MKTWRWSDLVLNPNGTLSQTKMFATIAHALLAATVLGVTIIKRDFVTEMWTLYICVAVAHRGFDKYTTKPKEPA